ncbi:hypothetical protein [Nonomuraea harbinensis]|uniref:DUF202 domain-containing protein n=1 Tax=Nonomuraea harbinensis TaxID=1286938 RepID=A0ABW1BMZ1_9ACTN|nr:hypothetical protein [Nonomuraea harbinensis]
MSIVSAIVRTPQGESVTLEWQVSDLHSLAMTRLFDRLGLFSLIVACLALFTSALLTPRWGVPNWTMPALGIIAAALAWPGMRKKPTVSTVSNRSRSVAGLVLGVIAIGLGALRLALDILEGVIG